MNTLNLILESSAAGISFALGAVAVLLLVSIYTARARKRDLAEIASENRKIADRCLRSALANERAAIELGRIATQLEENSK